MKPVAGVDDHERDCPRLIVKDKVRHVSHRAVLSVDVIARYFMRPSQM